MPTNNRVRNWKEYNTSLMARGNIFFYFPDINIGKERTRKRGGQQKYPDELIIFAYQIRSMFRLRLRQTQGYLKGLKSQMDLDIGVPDYTTLSRRLSGLKIEVKDYSTGKQDRAIAIDSTGIRIYDITDWHQKLDSGNRSYKGNDKWRKIHIMYDLDSKQVCDMRYTPGTYSDHIGAVEMLEKRNIEEIDILFADGAYDKYDVYKVCKEKMIQRTLIPPMTNARLSKDIYKDNHEKQKILEKRDQNIYVMKETENINEGRKYWKKQSGYHRRSQIETYMHALKRCFGYSFLSKTETNRQNEILIKINLLNHFKSLTLPIFY